MATMYRMISVAEYLDRLIRSFEGDQGSLYDIETETDIPSPWDRLSGFPSLEVAFNNLEHKARFRWALAGINKDSVSLEFKNDYLVLNIDNRDAEKLKDWTIIKSNLKTKAIGHWQYPISQDRFDTDQATAAWEDGILEVVIPLREDKKPKKLLIA